MIHQQLAVQACSKHEIELLFIAGFGSSLLFGTFIGSFADK